MRGVDTNILVRILTNDDPRRARAARRALDTAPAEIAPTVLLETAWVLKSSYGLAPDQVAHSLRGVLRHPALQVAEAEAVAAALDAHQAGLDFADALHAALSPDGLLTFDKRFARDAGSHPALGGVQLIPVGPD